MLQLNDLSNVFSAYSIAWSDTAESVDESMTDSIEDDRYPWWDGDRDIVDTHALADSQSVVLMGDTIHCEWGNSEVDYAIDVHEGEGSKPARRWTREAIRGDDTAPQQWQNPKAILDVPTHFADRFRAVYQ